MRDFINRSKEQWALLHTSGHPRTKLAVFIHGFRGGYLSTWGSLPDLLRDNADAATPFSEWDFLFVGYDTKRVATYLDISKLLCTQWNAASVGQIPFQGPYESVALFGHSLGTLGIRQLLCAWSEQPKSLLTAVHSVTLFGTPLNGSPWAGLALGYDIADALKPSNPQLRMLKTWSASAHSAKPWPLVRVVLGLDDRVVGSKYAELVQWVGDAEIDLTNLDHGTLVKPDGWHESAAIGFLQRGLR
jgi:triacylglycerol esterase/lipase EstA (alpha/beta hydrolase family)